VPKGVLTAGQLAEWDLILENGLAGQYAGFGQHI